MKTLRLTRRRALRCALALSFPFLWWGCGSSVPEGQLAVQPVSGLVTVAGKPAAGVTVVLHPQAGSPAAENGLKPSGTTDEQGAFHVSTYEQDDGAPAGDYQVTLRWMQAPATTKNGPPAGFAPLQDQFHGKYGNPQSSQWSIQVIEGDNVLDPISID